MNTRTIELNSIVTASSGHVSTELTGEMVILHLARGVYYGLDEVGTRIWGLIQTPARVADVLAVLLSEYDVAADQCEHDLMRLLTQLADEDLIEVKHAVDARTSTTIVA